MKKAPRCNAGPEVKSANSYSASISAASFSAQDRIDLAAEFAACDLPDDAACAWLRRQGVADTATWLWPGPVRTAQVETHPMGMFDFIETGPRAFVHPILTGPAFSDMADLVAWFPNDPSTWWTRRYTGLPLGADQLDRAEIEGLPIMLRQTPLDWLRAGGNGAVITDWTLTAPQLRTIPTIITADDVFGLEVRRRLTAPVHTSPEIRVKMIGRAA